MALLTTYYNFVRPHMALKFGKTLRTPALQAGLAKKRFSFREVFTNQPAFFLFVLVVLAARHCRFELQIVSVRLWESGQDSTTLA